MLAHFSSQFDQSLSVKQTIFYTLAECSIATFTLQWVTLFTLDLHFISVTCITVISHHLLYTCGVFIVVLDCTELNIHVQYQNY